jgi:hypothetical protein
MEKVWIEEHDRHIRLERLGPSLVLSAGQEIEWLDVTGRRVRQMEVEPPLNQREALTGARFPRGYPDTVAFLLAATDPTEVMTGPLLLGISKTNGHILRRIPAPAKPLFEFHPQGPVFVADTKTVSAFVP